MMRLLSRLFRKPAPAETYIEVGTAHGHDDLMLRVRLVQIQASIMHAAMLVTNEAPETHADHCACAKTIGEIQARVLGNRRTMGVDDARRVIRATFEHCLAVMDGGAE